MISTTNTTKTAAVRDSGNTNLSTLAAGQTFTGAWFDSDNHWVELTTSIRSDQAGTFTLQFSSDGVTADRTLGSYSLAANTDSPNQLAFIRRYFRLTYTNTSGSTANLRIETRVSSVAGVFTTRVSDTIGPLSPATLTRSVQFGRTEGGGVFRNTSMSPEGHPEISIQEPRTAFGELAVASDSPVIQLQSFQATGFNSRLHRRYTQGSGTVTVGTGTDKTLLKAATGTTTGSIADGGSLRRCGYRAGQGTKVMLTARFTTPTANTTQWAGFGDVCDGFAIGVDGVTPGLRHWRFGEREIRQVEITTAATGAETATITLNGVATNVALVNAGGNKNITANAIAAADYSANGAGWDAYAYASGAQVFVVFMSRAAISLGGAYTLASTGAAAGTFSQIIAGAAPTVEWIPTANFNIDVIDGDSTPTFPVDDNPSGFALDVTDLGVYKMQLQYLGNGDLFFKFENPDNGQFSTAHIVARAGEFATTSFGNMFLPCTIRAENGSTTSNITVSTASMFAGTEGDRDISGPSGVTGNRKASIGATETSVVGIMNPLTYNGQPNHTPIVVTELVLASNGGNNLTDWRVVRNPVLGTGATATASFVQQYDFAPTMKDTAFSTGATNGVEVIAPYQSLNTTTIRTFDPKSTDAGRIYPGEMWVVLASTAGSNITAGAAIAWRWDT